MLYKVILGQDKHDKKKRNPFKLYVYKTKKNNQTTQSEAHVAESKSV